MPKPLLAAVPAPTPVVTAPTPAAPAMLPARPAMLPATPAMLPATPSLPSYSATMTTKSLLPSFSTAPVGGIASPAPTAINVKGVKADVKEESNMLSTILRDEVAKFAQELADFQARSSTPLKGVIGSEADKHRLFKLTGELTAFGQDLNETTKTQDNEVRTLRTELLEVSALLDETRVRYSRRKNAGYNHLLKMRPLDPASRRKLAGIEQLYLHIEQQIEEASRKVESMNRERGRDQHSKPIEIPINEV